MDFWIFFHVTLLLNLYCLFEKIENKCKRGRGWPILIKHMFYTSMQLESYGQKYATYTCPDLKLKHFEGICQQSSLF